MKLSEFKIISIFYSFVVSGGPYVTSRIFNSANIFRMRTHSDTMKQWAMNLDTLTKEKSVCAYYYTIINKQLGDFNLVYFKLGFSLQKLVRNIDK